MQDIIFIRDLSLEAIIGIYPHEKIVKQPLLLDLDIYTDIRLAAQTGLIKDTVDYDQVVKKISYLVENSRFDLIESLIQRITDILLQEFRITKVQCTVYKPQAINNARTVGITIAREKLDH